MVTVSPLEVIDFPGCPTVVVRVRGLPFGRISAFMDDTFCALGTVMNQGAFTPAGPAFARYDAPVTDTVDLEAGFPLDEPLASPTTRVGDVDVVASDLPACRLATARYTGPYDRLGEGWDQFLSELRAAGHEPGLPFWEAYETEPTPDTDPDTLVTGLAIPVGKPAS